MSDEKNKTNKKVTTKKATAKKSSEKKKVTKSTKKPVEKKSVVKSIKKPTKSVEKKIEVKGIKKTDEVVGETKNKKQKEAAPSFSITEVIIIIIVTIIVSGIGSGTLIYRNYEKITEKYSYKNNAKYLNQLDSTFNELTKSYVGKVDKQKLVNAAISGMLKHLDDPYTSYLNEIETDELNEKLNGKYKGVGLEINSKEGNIVVNRVFDGPAKEAGMLKGDIITKIDGKDYKGKNASDVSEYILNKRKSKINIEVLRNNKTLKFTVIKKSVDYPTVYGEKIDGSGYISISSFGKKTSELFSDTTKDLEKQNINGLIIDLRGNTGGYLSSAYDIAEQFLIKGKTVYQLKTKGKTKKYKTKEPDSKNYKVVILIDGNSASASEVLTLALKEEYKAIVVGERSYGKGSVQQTKKLKDGSLVKYTTSKWLSPSGKTIDEVGVKPDYYVKYEPASENEKYDTQIIKALDLLK